jgi:hypothetical protein
MKTLTKRVFAIAGVLALGLTAVKAQSDGALLDALVKKGVLSDQEAEDIRASAAKDYAATPAGKLSISDHVTNLKLYGDARVRFEYLDEEPQTVQNLAAAGGRHSSTTERNRYRIRIGADYTFTNNFKAGVELESATAGDSANQSFGSEYGKFPINLGLVYLQWKPVDFLTLTGGKQRNPLYTTDLMWDPDINPEGASEVASWTFPIDFGSDTPASSDPKAVAPISAPSDMSLTVGLVGAQFDYSDNNEYNVSTGSTPLAKTDVWQFVEQVPIQFNFNKNTFVKVVPGFDSYQGGGISNPGTVVTVNATSTSNGGITTTTATSGSPGNNSALGFFGPHAADDLQIFTAPGEVDWKLWDIPFKAYWDFAYNVDGKDRIQNVYFGNQGFYTGTPSAAAIATQNQNKDLGDNIAWLAGLQVGQNKKKGDWSIKGDFRQVGLGAVDPNVNDSDFGDSFLNQQGIKLQSVYNFTDFLTGSLTFYDTWAYKNSLLNGLAGQDPTALPLGGSVTAPIGGSGISNAGGAGNANLAGIHSSQRVQVDLVWKF